MFIKVCAQISGMDHYCTMSVSNQREECYVFFSAFPFSNIFEKRSA